MSTRRGRAAILAAVGVCVLLAASVVGCKGGEKAPGPASGSDAGIALAKHVNAYYAGVPRRAVELRTSFSGSTASIEWGLVDGVTKVLVARVSAKGRTDLTVGTDGHYFERRPGESCWRSTSAPEELVDGPIIVLDGSTFSSPRRDGALTVLAVQEFDPETGDTGPSLYRVDAGSGRIATVRQEGLTATLRTLARFPTPPAVSPMCS